MHIIPSGVRLILHPLKLLVELLDLLNTQLCFRFHDSFQYGKNALRILLDRKQILLEPLGIAHNSPFLSIKLFSTLCILY
jgi:hypothetical protein